MGALEAAERKVELGDGRLRGERPRILGCLWDSSIFPGRAPAGKVLLRAMIGGAHDPEAVELDDETLLATVRRDLESHHGPASGSTPGSGLPG